jgi:uncharacterized protein YjcR
VARKSKYDWNKIREEFENTAATLKELAEKHNIAPGTVRSRKSREDWEKTKQKKNIATLQKKEKSPHDKENKENKERKFCGAKAKQTGQPCRRPAGWGTTHPGTGRCKLHGGCSPGVKGNKNARTHGAYETIIRDRLSKEEQMVFDAISDDSNMSQEIRILRFKLLRLLEPVEKEMIVGTKEGPTVKTLKVDEITKAYATEKLIDGIRKIMKDIKDTESTDKETITEHSRRVQEVWKERLQNNKGSQKGNDGDSGSEGG